MRSYTGFSLVEIVVGSALLGVVFVSLIATYGMYVKASLQNSSIIKATYLAEEGVEAIKSMRDRSWDAEIAGLTTDATYSLDFTTAIWKATTTPEIIDTTYTRSFQLSPVYRDTNSDIVETGGTLDPDTKKVAVSITFAPSVSSATTTKTLSAYITNMFQN